jgi:hypothetical protein
MIDKDRAVVSIPKCIMIIRSGAALGADVSSVNVVTTKGFDAGEAEGVVTDVSHEGGAKAEPRGGDSSIGRIPDTRNLFYRIERHFIREF